jgi:MarR family transcriptional regulator, 2-MHQ and catechol-resistance regulon repressor
MSAEPSKATTQAANAAFMPTMRELARTYQAFSAHSEAHIRKFNLTSAQFDVVATLGNTKGLCMGDIGDKTLITKGTLTGVIDRLIQKDLVYRDVPPDNRRSVIVRLTAKGEAVFEHVFPAHIAHVQACFEKMDPTELELLTVLLNRLKQTFRD